MTKQCQELLDTFLLFILPFSMRFCSFFPHFLGVGSQNGLDELGSVPDLIERGQHSHVDQVAAALLADAEHLVRDRDHAVDRDGAADPVVTAAIFVEGAQIEGGSGRRVARREEALGGGRHLQTLMGTTQVVVVDPLVEFALGPFQ